MSIKNLKSHVLQIESTGEPLMEELLPGNNDSLLLAQAVVILLEESVLQHAHHLQTREHSAHMVLGELYQLCSDLADEIYEVAAGAGVALDIAKSTSSFSYDHTPSLAWTSLHDALQTLEQIRRDLSSPHFQSMMDTVLDRLYRIRYLLSTTSSFPSQQLEG